MLLVHLDNINFTHCSPYRFTADKNSGVIRASDATVEEKHFGSSSAAAVGKKG